MLTSENDHLKSEVKKKTEDLRHLENDRRELQNKCRETKDEVTRLRPIWETAQRKKEQIETELQASRKKVATLETLLNKNEERTTLTDKEINLCKNKIADLEAELNSLRKKVSVMESYYEEAVRELDQVRDQLRETQENNSRHSIQLDTAKSEELRLKQQITNLQKDVAQRDEEIASLREKIESLEGDLFTNCNKLTKAESMISSLETQRAMFKEQLNDFRNKNIELKEEKISTVSLLKEQQALAESLRKSLIKKEETIEELHRRINELLTELDSLRQEGMTVKMSYESLQGLQEDTRLKSLEYKSNEEKANQALLDLRGSRDEMEEELKFALQKVTELEEKLSELQRERDRLKLSLNDTLKKLNKETEDGSQAQRELHDNKTIIERLTNNNKQLNSQIEELRALKVSLEIKLDNVRSEYEDSKSKNDDLSLIHI